MVPFPKFFEEIKRSMLLQDKERVDGYREEVGSAVLAFKSKEHTRVSKSFWEEWVSLLELDAEDPVCKLVINVQDHHVRALTKPINKSGLHYAAVLHHRLHAEESDLAQGYVRTLDDMAFGRPASEIFGDLFDLASFVDDPAAHRTVQFQKHIDGYLARLLEGYVAHSAEESCKKFLETRLGGIWLLAAGPGMGKSCIIASLSQQFLERYRTFAYFFRETDPRAENTTADFYERLNDWLRANFQDDFRDFEPPGSTPGARFYQAVIQLAARGRISRKKPMVVLVDALDEIKGVEFVGTESRNPLCLPEVMPEGFFIVCSARVKAHVGGSVETLPAFEEAPVHDQLCAIESEAEYSGHIETVSNFAETMLKARFVDRASEEDLDVCSGDHRIRGFAEALAAGTNYNFFMVRILVHDPEVTLKNADAMIKAQDFGEFFEKLFTRMNSSQTRSTNFRAIYALTLHSSLYRRTFRKLMRANPSDEEAANADASLDSWIRQGILDVTVSKDLQVVYPFHERFKAYLQDSFNYDTRLQFYDDFRDRVLQFNHSELSVRSFDDPEPRVTEEFLSLSVYIMISARAYEDLRTFLCHLEIWKTAMRTHGGIINLVRPLSRLRARRDDTGRMKDLYREVGARLWTWSNEGKIKLDGVSVTPSQLYPFLADENAKHGQASDTEFSYYFDEDYDMKILDRIEQSFSKFKSLRINRQFIDAKVTLSDIEQMFDTVGVVPFRTAARLHYEKAYLMRINGDYVGAALCFRRSGAVSGDADAGVRLFVGEYMARMTEFYSGATPPGRAFREQVEICASAPSPDGVLQQDQGLLRRFDFSSAKTLADVAFEAGSAEFPRLARACQEHAYMTSTKNGGGSPSHRLFFLQMESRLKMHAGEYAQANDVFASYLGPEGCTAQIKVINDEDSEFVKFLSVWEQEMAREYRDFARSILKSNRPDAIDFANKIYAAGLKLPDGSSNLRFKNDILEDLARLDPES